MSSHPSYDAEKNCRKRVRLDALRPGDVILIAGKSLDSKAIVRATAYGSPHRVYSHAAIVIYEHIWFESNDFGVGSIMEPIVKIEQHGNVRWRLADICRFDKFAVYRHPQLSSSLDKSELSDLITDITGAFAGKEYPSLAELRNATEYLSNYPKLKQGLLAMIDWYLSKGAQAIVPGPFCSETVALIYKELGAVIQPSISLFKDKRTPDFVSPSDLGDPERSLLAIQPDMIVNEDPTLEDVQVPGFDDIRRGSKVVENFNRLSSNQVKFMRASKNVDIESSKLKETLRKLTDGLQK
jgi:hypothetical protein